MLAKWLLSSQKDSLYGLLLGIPCVWKESEDRLGYSFQALIAFAMCSYGIVGKIFCMVMSMSRRQLQKADVTAVVTNCSEWFQIRKIMNSI